MRNMSLFSLLLFLGYVIIFILTIVFLIAFFPLNVSFLSNVDGFYYDVAVDFGVLLGLLCGSVGFGPEGGSFKFWLFSIPVYSTRWVDEGTEQVEKPGKPKPRRRRRNAWILHEPFKRLFGSFTRAIRVRKLDVSVTAGLSDPYASGLVFGVVYPVVEMARICFPPLDFSLTPVFVEERFASRLDGRMSLRIILMVVPLLRFMLSKEYRDYRRS